MFPITNLLVLRPPISTRVINAIRSLSPKTPEVVTDRTNAFVVTTCHNSAVRAPVSIIRVTSYWKFRTSRKTSMKSHNALSQAPWLFVLTTFASMLHAADSADIQILSATVRDQEIPGATVIVQKNGEQSYATTTDSMGRAQVRESLANDPSCGLADNKGTTHSSMSTMSMVSGPRRSRSPANMPGRGMSTRYRTTPTKQTPRRSVYRGAALKSSSMSAKRCKVPTP